MKYLKSILAIIFSIILLITVSGVGIEHHHCNSCDDDGCSISLLADAELDIHTHEEHGSSCEHQDSENEHSNCFSEHLESKIAILVSTSGWEMSAIRPHSKRDCRRSSRVAIAFGGRSEVITICLLF